jgi:hypothetical protein
MAHYWSKPCKRTSGHGLARTLPVEKFRTLAKEAAKADTETKPAKTKMLLEACKTQMQVATKLRLTVQSRTHPATAGRSHANQI